MWAPRTPWFARRVPSAFGRDAGASSTTRARSTQTASGTFQGRADKTGARIRAVTASETDHAASIALTNDTLGVRRELLAPLARAWRERSDDRQVVADAHFESML